MLTPWQLKLKPLTKSYWSLKCGQVIAVVNLIKENKTTSAL